MITTGLEVAGFASLCVAAFLVFVPLGFATAGVSAIVVGYLAGRDA